MGDLAIRHCVWFAILIVICLLETKDSEMSGEDLGGVKGFKKKV